MSYYWFNRQELLQKAKNRYHNCGGKKKLLNIISQIKMLSEEEKDKEGKYQKDRYHMNIDLSEN